MVGACEIPSEGNPGNKDVNQIQEDVRQDVKQEINSERVLLSTPILIPNIISQLSFGEVKIIHSIPVDARLKEWKGEIIIDVIIQKTTTFGKMFKKTVEVVRGVTEDLNKCRIITVSHKSTKAFSSGGNLSIGGANHTGSGGLSGGGALWPSWMRMTADDKIDLIIVRVVN